MDKEMLSKVFEEFANKECRGSCDLYEHLALRIAKDNDLLELAANASPGQPIPNLLFGAVQYLLLKGKEHNLRDFYGSIVDSPRGMEQSFTCFQDFCKVHEKDIISILKSKIVQTNEVRRCAYLYPSFCFIYNKVKKPLSLIEIGSSSGLQLLWDKYRYSYGSNEIYGDSESKVHIKSEIRGGNFPFLISESPPVAFKVGLDLHINDLSDPEDYMWLKSLIWPGHKERIELFEEAASHYNKQPAKLTEGDGVSLLTEVANQAPADTAICIFHTHVANQMPIDAKYELLQKVKVLGQTRDVFHLYNNIWDKKLHLDYFVNGKEYNSIVAETDGHARWFDWYL